MKSAKRRKKEKLDEDEKTGGRLTAWLKDIIKTEDNDVGVGGPPLANRVKVTEIKNRFEGNKEDRIDENKKKKGKNVL